MLIDCIHVEVDGCGQLTRGKDAVYGHVMNVGEHISRFESLLYIKHFLIGADSGYIDTLWTCAVDSEGQFVCIKLCFNVAGCQV